MDEAGDAANGSVLGRLLQELSSQRPRVRHYRSGGRGLENGVTAEVLTSQDVLPRRVFRSSPMIEEADFTFLPDQITTRLRRIGSPTGGRPAGRDDHQPVLAGADQG